MMLSDFTGAKTDLKEANRLAPDSREVREHSSIAVWLITITVLVFSYGRLVTTQHRQVPARCVCQVRALWAECKQMEAERKASGNKVFSKMAANKASRA